MKVLHLPTPVGGNAYGLSRAERKLGLQSDIFVLNDSWMRYPADQVMYQKLEGLKDKAVSLLPRLKKAYELSQAYDVFHFNFGTSLIDHPNLGLALLDVPIFKRQGKICVTYNGCDARQKYPTMQRAKIAPCHNADCYRGQCNSGKLDQERRKKIKIFEKHADHIFALNPDLMYFLPSKAQFLPYSIASWDELAAKPFQAPEKVFKILHAPTDRGAKGSAQVLAVFEQIKQKYGDRVELILVEKQPYEKALQLYQQADVIIDQILIGWYGAFAVESLKLGIPVMVFINRDDLHFIPEDMARDCLQAFINVEPDTLYAKLCELIENPSLLKEHREAGMEYIHKWHRPSYVAGLTKAIYES